MSAFHALDAARAAGIEVRLDGKDLFVSAASAPPADVLDMLRRSKLSIVDLLQQLYIAGLPQPTPPWGPADWLGLYDEKAAIGEFDRGLSRPAAEALAFDCCLAEWLYRNPVTSPPGPCPICGDVDRPNDDLLPVGLGGGEVWLHLGCSAAWRAARRAEAIAALAAIGITGLPGSSVTSEEITLPSKATGSTGQVGWED